MCIRDSVWPVSANHFCHIIDLSHQSEKKCLAWSLLVLRCRDKRPKCVVMCWQVVYKRLEMIQLTAPYIPGFLAFREVDSIIQLYKAMLKNAPCYKPDVRFHLLCCWQLFVKLVHCWVVSREVLLVGASTRNETSSLKWFVLAAWSYWCRIILAVTV